MACQFINGTSWHFFYFFRQRFSHDDFPVIKVNARRKYSAERKDATFYNEMLHLCFVIIISDGLQETLEMKFLKTSIAKVNSGSRLLTGVPSTEAAFAPYLQ